MKELALYGAAGDTVGKLLDGATKAIVFFAGVWALKSVVEKLLSMVGAFVFSGLTGSVSFVIVCAAVVFIFASSYLPKEMLLNKNVSIFIASAFIAVIVFSPPVIMNIKALMSSPAKVAAREHSQKKLTIAEVNGVLRPSDSGGYTKLFLELIEGQTPEEIDLLLDLYNSNSMTSTIRKRLRRDKITVAVIKYTSLEDIKRLYAAGLLELEGDIGYRVSSFEGVYFSVKREPIPKTALEVAKLKGRKDVVDWLENDLKIKQKTE